MHVQLLGVGQDGQDWGMVRGRQGGSAAPVGKQTRSGRMREGTVGAQCRLGFELGVLCVRLRTSKRCCCLDLHDSLCHPRGG